MCCVLGLEGPGHRTKQLTLNYVLCLLKNFLDFTTGFWTTPTNGFGGFLCLEKNP